MPVPSDYPTRVRALRLKLGLKQPEFAASMNVSVPTVSRWENRQNEPTDLAWARLMEMEASLVRPVEARPQRLSLTFGADPDAVSAVAEAARLSSGHVSSPTFATEISLIDPLPHQRVAVYDSILPHWPIRFLLADDAGAGKTIMAGLSIRELLSRRLVRRVLIVPPAGLVGNWQRELANLFRIQAKVVRGKDAARSNPFIGAEADFAVCSIDTLRSRNARNRLRDAGQEGHAYDLVIFDEAHKLSANQDADASVRKTDRYRLAEVLAGIVPDDPEWDLGWAPQSIMLLTATPHMGKAYPYFALWRLLDPDAISTPEALQAFPSDRKARHFIRRTKEEMVKLDGSPLYARRECDTLGFDLSDEEFDLYEQTSAYIRDVYNKASSLNRSAAQLAMSVFQRRLASSTYALMRSFERRIERLEALMRAVSDGGEAVLRKRQAEIEDSTKQESGLRDLFETTTADEDQEEGAEAHERSEDGALEATTARTLADLIVERDRVEHLRKLAMSVLDRGSEAKFSKLLEAMKEPRFRDEKLLIFTEHRDTANYLTERLEALGYAGKVAQLHGAMDYVERDRQVEFFRKPIEDGGAKYLVATDAAGEGVNLQFCWLMVNYDIPWNPARLEQRMGRIHRYGQKKDAVYIANLVAPKTREGRVLKTLLEKLEAIRKELGSDKVFDVIGRLFENVPLKSYLDAALEGRDATASLEGMLSPEQVKAMEARDRTVYGPAGEVKMSLPAMRAAMDQERYLRLMPGYVQGLVERSAPLLGLRVEGSPAETFHFVPEANGALDPLAFEIEAYRPEARRRLTVRRPSSGEAAIWLHPGEPVFDALAGEVGRRFADDALAGAVFVDPHADEAFLFHLAQVTVVRRGRGEDLLEHRLVGLRQRADGFVEECPVEHLLLLRGTRSGLPGAYAAGRAAVNLTKQAERFLVEAVGGALVEAHRNAILADLPERIRLTKVGFNKQDSELSRARNRLRQGAKDGRKQAVLQLELVKKRQDTLSSTREARLAALQAEPSMVELGDVRFLAHALIVPPTSEDDAKQFDENVEAAAVRLVIAHEESFGAKVQDVSKATLARAAGLGEWPGFDLLSRRSEGAPRCIEVKGRADSGAVFMSDNEWAKAANLPDRYWLYVVLDCATPNPRLLRVRDPFGRLTGMAKGGMTLKVGDIVAMAEVD